MTLSTIINWLFPPEGDGLTHQQRRDGSNPLFIRKIGKAHMDRVYGEACR